MASKSKPTNVKQPYDKTNEVKQLCTYITIVNQGNGNAVSEIFKRAGANAQFIQIGEGTASKHVMDILGIENNKKEIVISLIAEDRLKDATTELAAFIAASKRNQGIGFSISMTGIAGVRMYQFLANL